MGQELALGNHWRVQFESLIRTRQGTGLLRQETEQAPSKFSQPCRGVSKLTGHGEEAADAAGPGGPAAEPPFYTLFPKVPRGVPGGSAPNKAELRGGSMRKRPGRNRGDHPPTFFPETARPSPGSPGTRPGAIESDSYSVHQP